MAKVVSVTHTGNFKKTDRFLSNIVQMKYRHKLNRYGERGVKALKEATPLESGETADSWSYEIEDKPGELSIYWKNDNINDGVNIAVILQYGHGTRNGGWVEGIDYINPALKPVFQQMIDDVWKEVVSS